MTKLRKILSSKRGNGAPMILVITLCLCMLLAVCMELFRLKIIASGVKEAVQSAVISTVTDNYDDVYHSVREGYAGGYKPGSSSWNSSVDYGDIYAELDRVLGLKSANGYHIKYAGKTLEYRISGLSVNIKNTPLAPQNAGTTQPFLADAVIQLEVPVSFCGKSLPLMKINLKVQAKYMPVF